MTIKLVYELYTDGDYVLRNPEVFGAKRLGDYKYKGMFSIEGDEFTTKTETRRFLEKFLCDGISVNYTHHFLLMDFCLLIDSLIHVVYEDREDIVTKEMSGNYEGTVFTLIKEDC